MFSHKKYERLAHISNHRARYNSPLTHARILFFSFFFFHRSNCKTRHRSLREHLERKWSIDRMETLTNANLVSNLSMIKLKILQEFFTYSFFSFFFFSSLQIIFEALNSRSIVHSKWHEICADIYNLFGWFTYRKHVSRDDCLSWFFSFFFFFFY